MPGIANRLFSRIALVAALSWLTFVPATAAELKDTIKSVIESQLNAFAVDDGGVAYTYAAPIVKSVFPTPEQFMAMVKKGYQPVYRNTQRIYGDVTPDSLGRPSMRVFLTGQDGKRYEAQYSMEQQPDGSWKIAGCSIVEMPAQEV